MTTSRLVLLLLVFALVSNVTAQSRGGDEAQLRQLLNEFLSGAGRGDADVHDRFWADDLIYTRSSGSRIGKTELMNGVRSAPARKEGDPVTVYSAEDVKVQIYGAVAVVAFRLVGTTARSDGSKAVAEFFNTGTFVKRKGIWKAVAWQATAIPKPRA